MSCDGDCDTSDGRVSFRMTKAGRKQFEEVGRARGLSVIGYFDNATNLYAEIVRESLKLPPGAHIALLNREGVLVKRYRIT